MVVVRCSFNMIELAIPFSDILHHFNALACEYCDGSFTSSRGSRSDHR